MQVGFGKIKYLLAIVVMCASACSQHHALREPENSSGKLYGNRFEKGEEVNHQNPEEMIFASHLDCSDSDFEFRAVHYRADRALLPDENILNGQSMLQIFNRDLPLSPGDLVDIQIEYGDGFSGRYVINPGGSLQLPVLSPVKVAGLTTLSSAEKVELALVRGGIFKAATAKVALRVLHWAPIEVTVAGAVFEPGRVRINDNNQESVIAEKVVAFGDHAAKRSLSEALRAASGIRPDAKLDQVILVRKGWQLEFDMSGILLGKPVQDISLVAGDHIVVPTTGCFQPELARPSQITPKGFRVFMSNLVSPAFDNASGAVGRYSSNLPYGSRLLQAAVSANCVGGTQLTNAPRKVVLASRNPLTGDMQVVERSVEQLLRYASREDTNPYLMPGDAVACYDSDVTNLRDAARTVSDLLLPLKILL